MKSGRQHNAILQKRDINTSIYKQKIKRHFTMLTLSDETIRDETFHLIMIFMMNI